MTRFRPHVAPPDTNTIIRVQAQAHATALRGSQAALRGSQAVLRGSLAVLRGSLAVMCGSGLPACVVSGLVMNRLHAALA